MDYLDNIMKASQTRQRSSKRIRIVCAGRFYWGKGFLHLLRSLAHLTHIIGFEDFQLEMFGRGPLEGKIRRLIMDSNLSRNVRLRGFVKNDQLMTTVATSDIVCFPSLYEACPVGMIEAMALGKPIVAFDKPFSREMLGHDKELPLSRNIGEYARNLHLLCTSEDLRLRVGSCLRDRARNEFDIKIVADKYLHLYKDLSCGQTYGLAQ